MKWCAENRKKLLFGQWMFLLNIVFSRRGGRNVRGWEKNCHSTFLHVLHPVSKYPFSNRIFLTLYFRYWPSTVCPALKWDPWYCPQRTSCRTWPQPGTLNDTSNLPCLSMMSDQVSFMRCFTLQMFLFDIYFYRRWGYWERGMRKIISHSTQDLGGNPGWTRRQCLSFILWFQLSFIRFAEHSKSLAL